MEDDESVEEEGEPIDEEDESVHLEDGARDSEAGNNSQKLDSAKFGTAPLDTNKTDEQRIDDWLDWAQKQAQKGQPW